MLAVCVCALSVGSVARPTAQRDRKRVRVSGSASSCDKRESVRLAVRPSVRLSRLPEAVEQVEPQRLAGSQAFPRTRVQYRSRLKVMQARGEIVGTF